MSVFSFSAGLELSNARYLDPEVNKPDLFLLQIKQVPSEFQHLKC